MMKIIPAIDLFEGKCVRLKQGKFHSVKVYSSEPLTVAQDFEAAGIERLHLVDLEGAKKGRVVHWKTLREIARNTSLALDFSGGISRSTDVEKALSLGASYVSVGTIAVREPETLQQWIADFGPERILASVDVVQDRIAVRGWLEKDTLSLNHCLGQLQKSGIKVVIVTSIEADGMLKGPDVPMYKKLTARFHDMDIIASGGISCIDDIGEIKKTGCSGVIIGKAIYEEKITLSELKRNFLCSPNE